MYRVEGSSVVITYGDSIEPFVTHHHVMVASSAPVAFSTNANYGYIQNEATVVTATPIQDIPTSGHISKY